MKYDQAILEEVLAEYPPEYATWLRHFFTTYEKVNGCWVSQDPLAPPLELCDTQLEGSRDTSLTLKAETARRSQQSEPEGLTGKEVRS